MATTAPKLAVGKGDAGSTLAQSFNNSRISGGYREDYKLDLCEWRNSSYAILTSGTTPIVEVSANEPRITWAASDTSIAYAGMTLDHSFSDISTDLQFVGRFHKNGTTDAIALVLIIYARATDGALKGPFTATGAIAKAAATNPADVVFNFTGMTDSSGNHIAPGDRLTFQLDSGAHTTDAVYFYGGILQRARNPGYTDTNRRFKDYSL